MPDNKAKGTIDDFELPPLPKLPKVPMPDTGLSSKPEEDMPKPRVKPALDDDIPAPKAKPSLDDDMPMPKHKPSIEQNLGAARSALSFEGDKPSPRPKPALDENTPMPDYKHAAEEKKPTRHETADLPPVMDESTPSAAPIAAPMKKQDDFEEYIISSDTEPDPEPILESMNAPKLAPMTSNRESSQKEMKEKIRMSDLQMGIDAPRLDDLSDEYGNPKKRAKDLTEQDHLDRDEKEALRRKVQEDLARVPENYNARQSKKMYNKLMEEKQLKIAKKGFVISIIPILLGVLGAVICFYFLGWNEYEQIFHIIALFGAAGALLLLIKSNHAKLFAMTVYAISLIGYIGLGLFFYLYQSFDGKVEYDLLRMVLGVAASACNIGALLILSKNEAVNVYYSTKSKRRT